MFLHHVLPGPASQSYGLAVAQLAGVPSEVILRAREHLARLKPPACPTNCRPNGSQVRLRRRCRAICSPARRIHCRRNCARSILMI